MSETPQRETAEMPFLDHVEVLRGHILRALGWLLVGMIGGFAAHGWILRALETPYIKACESLDKTPKLLVLTPTEGLMISLYTAFIGGLVISCGLVFREMWLFIRPGLYDKEKRWIKYLIPGSVLLFLAGVVFCYWIAPRGLIFLIRWNDRLGLETELRIGWYLTFVIRLMLAFGIVFQLPLVMMFLAMAEMVTARQMLSKWRHAVIIILIASAIITPTWDVVTLLALSLPVVGLYMLSVVLAMVVEWRRRRRRRAEPAPLQPPADTVPMGPAIPRDMGVPPTEEELAAERQRVEELYAAAEEDYHTDLDVEESPDDDAAAEGFEE